MPVTDKSRVLYIVKYLQQQTDEDNPATTTDILNHLSTFGIEAGRKTIASDIEHLQKVGFDIICIKSRQNKYFIGSRSLELSELKMLVDAVQAAVFIPPAKSKKLISELSSLASAHQAEELKRRLYVNDRVKTSNNEVLYTVDTIYSAIASGKCLKFKSYDYSPKKRKVFKHGGQDYIFSPYDLVWSNDRYYVFGYSESHRDIVKFRVDRIYKPQIVDVPAREKPKGYSISGICKRTFLMYDAEICSVELLCTNDTANAVIDRFGIDADIKESDSEHFIVTANVALGATFFAWIFTYGGKIRIISPKTAIDEYKCHLEVAYKNL